MATQMTGKFSPLIEYGDILLDTGLPIIPLICGQKRPAIPNWPNTCADKNSVNLWCNNFLNGGVGLLTDKFPTIDIDFPGGDNKQRVQDAVKICEEELRTSLDYIKIGSPPKLSIICRSIESFGPKIKGETYLDDKKRNLSAEILGSGQQTVLFNTHPKTKKPYLWPKKSPIDNDFSIDSLPILTADIAQIIIDRIEKEILSDLTPPSTISPQRKSAQCFKNYKPPCNFSIDQIMMDLEVLDPDLSYSDWIKIGMALFHQFNGTNEGLEIFVEWSAKGTKYTPESATDSPEAKWKTFRSDLNRKPVTFATVHLMANELRQQKISSQQGFKFIPFNEMLSHEINTEWLISGFLDTGSIALIFGESGTHKSFLALDIALCIATGKNWHGYEVKKVSPVFYIAGEGFAGISKRLKAWKKENKNEFEGSYIPFFTSNMAMEALNQKSANSVKEAIQNLSAEHGNPGLVIIDTLARNFGPGSENDTEDMSRFVSVIDFYIKGHFGCTVLIIHHSGLSDKGRARGNYALKAALDWEYMVSKKDNLRVLENTKTKDHDPPPSLIFNPKIVTIVNFEKAGNSEPITSCVLELSECTQNTFVQKKLPPPQGIILKALQDTIPVWNLLYGTEETKCDFEKLWRESSIANGISSGKEEAQTKAFKRAKKVLLRDGYIKEEDGLYFPVDQTTKNILSHVTDKRTTLDMS